MNELFIRAAKNKYRFPFKGQITSEDLFDLKLEDLDSIYKSLNKQVVEDNEASLLSTNKVDKELHERIEIVKYVFMQKQKEKEEALLAAEKKQKREKILSAIANKKEQNLQNASIEELEAMLNEI